MAANRMNFQGVTNIIRFNWHFYAIAGLALLVTNLSLLFMPLQVRFGIFMLTCVIGLLIISSLLVSWYVYDLSDLYTLNWLNNSAEAADHSILNIHAGFDETSSLLKRHFPNAKLTVMDFYDASKHTEVSIRRARKRYPPYPGTVSTSTTSIHLANNSIDTVFAILAAHEIRNDRERVAFFCEIARTLQPKGAIFVVEHLRDIPNFLAYNIGFFHFLSRSTWIDTFNKSRLNIASENKVTPFVTIFTLTRHDTAH